MSAKLPFRISSLVLLLFALGHTVGFLSFRPKEPEAAAVLESMRRVPFHFGRHNVHWMDLYTGFGLAISVAGFAFVICLATEHGHRRGGAFGTHDRLALVPHPNRKRRPESALLRALQGAFSLVCAGLLAWGARRL